MLQKLTGNYKPRNGELYKPLKKPRKIYLHLGLQIVGSPEPGLSWSPAPGQAVRETSAWKNTKGWCDRYAVTFAKLARDFQPYAPVIETVNEPQGTAPPVVSAYWMAYILRQVYR